MHKRSLLNVVYFYLLILLCMEHSKINADLRSWLAMEVIYVILPSLQLGEDGAWAEEVSDLLVVME